VLWCLDSNIMSPVLTALKVNPIVAEYVECFLAVLLCFSMQIQAQEARVGTVAALEKCVNLNPMLRGFLERPGGLMPPPLDPPASICGEATRCRGHPDTTIPHMLHQRCYTCGYDTQTLHAPPCVSMAWGDSALACLSTVAGLRHPAWSQTHTLWNPS